MFGVLQWERLWLRKGKQMSLLYQWISSPVGRLQLVASDKGLVAILWEKERSGRVRLSELIEDKDDPVLRRTEEQLREYFEGRRQKFAVPLDLRGTPFQKQVWEALLDIPFGATRSYGQLATQLGNPKWTRAVGAANGRNPVSIIAPCHRVIGSSGKLTGFAGGLEAKAYLLTLEGNGGCSSPNTRPSAVKLLTPSRLIVARSIQFAARNRIVRRSSATSAQPVALRRWTFIPGSQVSKPESAPHSRENEDRSRKCRMCR